LGITRTYIGNDTELYFHQYIHQNQRKCHNYYYKLLHPSAPGKYLKKRMIVQYTNDIYHQSNFIGISERMDESVVVLMMLLNLTMVDVLFLDAKTQVDMIAIKGVEHHVKKSNQQNYYPIWNHFCNPIKWKRWIQFDMALYRAISTSLDLTMESLGHSEFDTNLQTFRQLQQVIQERCLPDTKFPCDENGQYHYENETKCLWHDSGCGTPCLDEVATEFEDKRRNISRKCRTSKLKIESMGSCAIFMRTRITTPGSSARVLPTILEYHRLDVRISMEIIMMTN
jgi:hypothetical protein